MKTRVNGEMENVPRVQLMGTNSGQTGRGCRSVTREYSLTDASTYKALRGIINSTRSTFLPLCQMCRLAVGAQVTLNNILQRYLLVYHVNSQQPTLKSSSTGYTVKV